MASIPLGASSIVGGSEIHFDEIKACSPDEEHHNGAYLAITGSTMLEAASFER